MVMGTKKRLIVAITFVVYFLQTTNTHTITEPLESELYRSPASEMLAAIHAACRSHLELMLASEIVDENWVRRTIGQDPAVLDFTEMAADNDLYLFALTNLEQKKRVGSNENLVIFVDLHMRRPHTQKITKRLVIYKNRIVQVGPDDLSLDSGSAETLLDGLMVAHHLFPKAHQFYVDFWNHGSGDVNPTIKTAVNPFKLFHYNPETRLIELDRSIGFLDYICMMAEVEGQRGICFDESTGNYLDDQKLMSALSAFCNYRGKKFDVIVFDACLMAGTGTAWIMHHFADYMVASEEVVLGPGYNYTLVHSRVAQATITPEEYAKHVVRAFEKTYGSITNDYTHSAINLKRYPELSAAIDKMARLFIDGLHSQINGSMKKTLQKSSNKAFCTHFDEPSYIDLHHFCLNMISNLSSIQCKSAEETQRFKTQLEHALYETVRLIEEIVFINVSGKNVSKARGITIYFPERSIHSSYPKTEFALHNAWGQFLEYYFSTREV